jgi:hypothetical protein
MAGKNPLRLRPRHLPERKPLNPVQRAIAAGQLTANETQSLKWLEAALSAPPPPDYAAMTVTGELGKKMRERKLTPPWPYLRGGRDLFRHQAEREAFAELTSDDGTGYGWEYPEGAELLRRERRKAYLLMAESNASDADCVNSTLLSEEQVRFVRTMFEQRDNLPDDDTGICGF